MDKLKIKNEAFEMHCCKIYLDFLSKAYIVCMLTYYFFYLL